MSEATFEPSAVSTTPAASTASAATEARSRIDGTKEMSPRTALRAQVRRLGTFALLAGLAACAAPSHAKDPTPADKVEVTRGELDRLRALEPELARVKARQAELERALADAQQSLEVAEQRLGLRPFAPRSLLTADFALKSPADAQRLDGPGATGKRQSLAKALASTRRGAVVAFWATWCKPCTSPEELQRLTRMKRELAKVGANLVFFSVDETLSAVTADPRAPTWLYPLWQGNDAHLGMLPRAWIQSHGVELPVMLVVAPDGQVRWVRKGALDEEAERDLLTAVIRSN